MYASPVYYILSFGLFIQLSLEAQISPHYIDQLTTSDGLSSNLVSDITQDQNGFLWIATSNGLNRYDGTEVVQYYFEENRNSLANNKIHRLIHLDSCHIAVATNNGLSVLDTRNYTFQNKLFLLDSTWRYYENLLLFMEKDALGNLWIGTPVAVYRLNEKLQVVKVFRSDYTVEDIGNKRIYFVYQILPLSTGEVLIWLDSGWHIWDSQTDTLLPGRNQPAGQWTTIDDALFEECTEVYNRYLVYLNNRDQMLEVIDEKTGQKAFCRISEIPRNEGISIKNVFGLNDGWVGLSFYDKGLSLIKLAHTEKGFKIIIDSTLYFPEHLFSYGISDKEGNWWITSKSNGVSKISPNQPLFSRLNLVDNVTGIQSISEITSFFSLDKKIFIASYGDGLYTWSPRSGLLDHHSAKDYPWTENKIWNCSMHTTDTLWLGTQRGLLWYNLKTEKLGRLEQHHPKIMDSVAITTQFTDSHGLVWMGLGVGYGLCVYNKNNKSFQLFPNAPGAYPFRYPIGIVEDNNSNLWFISDATAQLVKWDRKENRFQAVIIPEFVGKIFNSTGNLFLDASKGLIWYGVNNVGLVCYNIQTAKLKTFGIDAGLNSTYINDVKPDDYGNLWITTLQGISSFNTYTEQFINYYDRDGLITGYSCTALQYDSISGQMLVGGWGTVFYFSPRNLGIKKDPLRARLTDVKINNNQYLLSTDEPLNLSWKENDISLAFTAINLTNGEDNLYSYKLGPDNAEWVDLGHQRQIRFASLTPDTYTFTVKAARRDGQWSPFTESIHFTIRPPFVKTIWFYLLTFLTIAGLFNAWYRYRLMNMLKMQKIRTRISKDLHDDIGSRLTNISMMSQLAIQHERTVPGQGNLLEKIQEESQAISHSLREIVWNIDPENDTFEEIMPRMLHFATGILENKNIEVLASLIELKDIKLNMDQRRDLFLIFKETIHNIVRHSGARQVFLSTRKEKNLLIIRIVDDGRGFDIRTISYGNGLQNMKHRAQKHHWDLQVISQPDEGTQVILEIKIT